MTETVQIILPIATVLALIWACILAWWLFKAMLRGAGVIWLACWVAAGAIPGTIAYLALWFLFPPIMLIAHVLAGIGVMLLEWRRGV